MSECVKTFKAIYKHKKNIEMMHKVFILLFMHFSKCKNVLHLSFIKKSVAFFIKVTFVVIFVLLLCIIFSYVATTSNQE